MKKTLKKVLAGVTTLATMATALVPLNASAVAIYKLDSDSGEYVYVSPDELPKDKLLGVASDGTEIWGSCVEELLGFDKDGNPIIGVNESAVYSSSTDTEVDLSDCPEGGTPTEDESDDDSLYSEPTNIRGDVNYDGLVNNVDVMLLRKYILHMVEW